MSFYIPEGTPPFITNAMVRVERRLPVAGEVLERAGKRVEPEDIVAKAFVPAPPQIINVARLLAIAPAQVERAMRREVNNRITQNEVLARTGVIGGRRCLSPVSGIITAVDSTTGYVTVLPDPPTFELRAAIRGVVMEILPQAGVVIETPAAQVYGAFGVGKERSGVLRLICIDPNEAVQTDQIDGRSRYAILIGGSSITAAALSRAVREQVSGIIVGGIEESELRTFLGWNDLQAWRTGSGTWVFPNNERATDPGLTLVVTEGFGTRPMSQPLFELLITHAGQEAFIEGLTRLRRPMARPRVVIPLPRSVGAQLELPRPQLRPGAMVRRLDPRHLGVVAHVRSLPTQPRRIDIGIRVAAVEIMHEDGTTIWLPRTAVEVLG